MTEWLLIGLGIGAISILVAKLEPRFRKIPEPLASRPDQSVEEIRVLHYADLPFESDAFALLWRDIAGVFAVPPARMRPTDRFGIELPLSKTLIRDEDMEIATVIRKYAKQRRMPEPVADVACVDDVIRALATPVSLSDSRGP
jgi:hypothetical protein